MLFSFAAQTGYGMEQEKQLGMDQVDVILKNETVRHTFSDPVLLGFWQGKSGAAFYKLGDKSGKIMEIQRRKRWDAYIFNHVSQSNPFAVAEYEQVKKQQKNLQHFISLNPSTGIYYDRVKHQYLKQGRALKGENY